MKHKVVYGVENEKSNKVYSAREKHYTRELSKMREV
jgi:hypothetical protein